MKDKAIHCYHCEWTTKKDEGWIKDHAPLGRLTQWIWHIRDEHPARLQQHPTTAKRLATVVGETDDYLVMSMPLKTPRRRRHCQTCSCEIAVCDHAAFASREDARHAALAATLGRNDKIRIFRCSTCDGFRFSLAVRTAPETEAVKRDQIAFAMRESGATWQTIAERFGVNRSLPSVWYAREQRRRIRAALEDRLRSGEAG